MVIPSTVVLIALTVSVFWILCRCTGYSFKFESKITLNLVKVIVVVSYLISSFAVVRWLMKIGIH